MSFALDLSHRLSGHEEFKTGRDALQRVAALQTIIGQRTADSGQIDDDRLWKLLYCADVFAQTEDDRYRRIAQEIALNALLVDDAPTWRDRSLRILTDLGNFPAIAYLGKNTPESAGTPSLTDMLRLSISRELNSVSLGGDIMALTDFQKDVWEKLPSSQALAISAPTSAGKSFLVIEHLCRLAETTESFTAVYIAPTRALLSEVHEKILKRLSKSEDIRISTVPTEPLEEVRRQIFILTQERLQVLLTFSQITFDLIVADEAQNLSDGSRGMILQECLEQALSRKSDCRLLLLAPGAEGFDDVGLAVGRTDLKVASSQLPSVVQNRIVVTRGKAKNSVDLRLLDDGGMQAIGTLTTNRGFDLPATRLSAVALELGATGGSLVYSTGPGDSEKVAGQLSQSLPKLAGAPLNDLAEFIETHIHPQYGLADLVRKGVAFHYGKMPTLLREALELAFKAGDLKYLACTTTLFQGVNLPARNVFIDTPKRGSGKPLDPAAMWNFAGRAGRMTRDIVGNVFLVDYDEWPDKPMDRFVGYRIKPAFDQAVQGALPRVFEALRGDMPKVSRHDEEAGLVRSAAGLLISRAAKGDVDRFVGRTLSTLQPTSRHMLILEAERAQEDLALPTSLLATNWTVDPFGLRRLYDNLVDKIVRDGTEELMPINPHHDAKGARDRYVSIFMRIQRTINRDDSKFSAVAAGTAVQWMRGVPYPVLLSRAVDKAQRKYDRIIAENTAKRLAAPNVPVKDPKPVDINAVIRKEFDMIEDVIRFQYVQLGNAYVDILKLALRDTIKKDQFDDVFNFPLALELGVATQSGWSFMELGLSRIAASALEPKYPSSALTVQQARSWLAEVDVQSLRLNPVIVDELKKLNLVRTDQGSERTD